jgi:hypothetical protein
MFDTLRKLHHQIHRWIFEAYAQVILWSIKAMVLVMIWGIIFAAIGPKEPAPSHLVTELDLALFGLFGALLLSMGIYARFKLNGRDFDSAVSWIWKLFPTYGKMITPRLVNVAVRAFCNFVWYSGVFFVCSSLFIWLMALHDGIFQAVR